MDYTQAGQTFSKDYDSNMKALQDADQRTRDFITARQQRELASGQTPYSNTQQVPASGDADVSLPESPAVAPAPADTTAAPVSDATGSKSNSQLVSESSRRLQALKNAAPTQEQRDKAGLLTVPAAAADVLTLPINAGRNVLGYVAAGAQNISGKVVNAIAGKKVLPTDTDYGNVSLTPYTDKYVRPTTQAADAPATEEARLRQLQAQDKPATTPPATPNAPTKYDPIIQSSAESAGIDPTVLKRLLDSESSFNPTAVSPRGAQYGYGIAQIAAVHGLSKQQMEDPNVAIPFAANLLKKYADKHGGDMNAALLDYKGAKSAEGIAAMQPFVDKITGKVPAPQAQPQAAAPAPQGQPQAAAPAPQGPQFVAANGSKFTIPQQYNDGQIQQMQQNVEMAQNAAHLAWIQYQQNPSQQAIAQYQQVNGQIQQLHQGLYDAKIYALTQQAQGGNKQSFRALLNEYSNKVNQPIQMRPEGNGLYSAVAKGGQVIAHGSPSDIAGTFGGVLNSAARAFNMKIAQIHAEEYAKESAKHPLETAKLANALAISQGENAAKMTMEKIKLGKLISTSNVNGQFVLVDSDTGQATLVDPAKPNQIGAPTQYHLRTP